MDTTLGALDGARTRTALAPLLHHARVDDALLDERYHALLQLVDKLLGVVPNCDRYLEIWPPAFRTYNIMVPNLLNLPVPVLGLGGPPPGAIGLAMYVASRTAECPYCSAHSCSFALRRGAAPETVAAALFPGEHTFSRGDLAVIAVARSLARVPCELTVAEKAELVDVFGEDGAEWIVLSIVMMGFLNKFMDAVGVELEQSVVDEVSATMGADWAPGHAGADLDPTAPRRPAPPADGLRTKLRLLPLLPGAIRYDRQVQRGTPAEVAKVGAFLSARTGHDFPVLASLRSKRARRSVASMLRENLDPATTVIGLDVKVLAGEIFATVVGDAALSTDIHSLARSAGIDGARLTEAAAFAAGEVVDPLAVPGSASALLALARAAASSPARIDQATVAACERAGLTAEAIIELVTWLSVLQLLHRLGCYVAPPA